MARPQRGFTLVEVLVAIALLALLTGMAWRGIDGLLRAREAGEASIARSSRLQTVVAQWERDLGELQDSQVVPALDFDGRALRFTRRAAEGLQVVVWWVEDGKLWRWASAPVGSQPLLIAAYRRSQQTSTLGPQALVALTGVSSWQLAYFRLNAWTNAMSSADLDATTVKPPEGVASAPSAGASSPAGEVRASLPSGIRLRLEFGEGSGFGGPLLHQTLIPGGT